jgi:hypothetical protein
MGGGICPAVGRDQLHQSVFVGKSYFLDRLQVSCCLTDRKSNRSYRSSGVDVDEIRLCSVREAVVGSELRGLSHLHSDLLTGIWYKQFHNLRNANES